MGSCLAVSDSAVFISIDCRVQEIWSHKITNAYRTMKHALIQGLSAPNVTRMLEHVFIKPLLCLMVATSSISTEERVQEI